MYYTYIITNQTNTTLYIGVTNDLERRLYEHKNGIFEGFSKRYHLHKLVYYEVFHEVNDAILCEKRWKGWRREKKLLLIESKNPNWDDLGETM